MIDDEDIVQDFIEEARDHLHGIENDLLFIENEGISEDKELINKVFRAIHSIKGGAGFLGLNKIKELSHVQEDILNKLRHGELAPTETVIGPLLSTVDLLSRMINDWQNSNEVDITGALSKLRTALGSAPNSDAPHIESQQSRKEAIVDNVQKEPELTQDLLERLAAQGNTVYKVEVRVDDDLTVRGKTLSDFLQECLAAGQIISSSVDYNYVVENQSPPDSQPVIFQMLYATVLDKDLIGTLIPVPEDRIRVITEMSHLDPPQDEEDDEDTAEETATSKAKNDPQPESSLRVNIRTLDKLMNLTSELVLARNQLTKGIRDTDNPVLDKVAQRLDSITSNLQLTVVSTRMQPIGKVFNKFRRVVRDLANMLNKKIDLVIEGETVELDKTIIETINDPITHLVRNACDHGLETPAVRKECGKEESGTLQLRAFHEAGQVVIEIIDDGAGVDPQLVKRKALANSNFDPDQIRRMSDSELVRLIFKPGFSTAKQVSEISGRGVGMDVVHTNFAKLGGVVDVKSELGKGTTVSVKLPLTLAIIPSLMVDAQDHVFAIPQANLVELVSISPKDLPNRVHELGHQRVLRLRGSLLPLIDLAEVLQIPKNYMEAVSGEIKKDRRSQLVDRRSTPIGIDPKSKISGEHPPRGEDRRRSLNSYLSVVVVASGNSQFGLVVDRFLDSEEIVVKPLDSFLKACHCYAGATIQGNGKVALILDILGISEKVQLSDSERELAEAVSKEAEETNRGEIYEVLSFSYDTTDHFAVPLSSIERIERVPSTAVEMTASRPHIQYRDRTLPLFSMEEVADVLPRKDSDFINILVFCVGGKEMGLITNRIEDIHEVSNQVDESTFRRSGILGSTIIQGNTTLLIDLFDVVNTLYPHWTENLRPSRSKRRPTVLLVENSSFYRTRLKDLLEQNGCDVTSAEDGLEGLKALEDGPNFSMIITDLDMPNMDGLMMTQQIRQDRRFSNLPIVALTSPDSELDEQEGRTAGVDDYLEKLDQDEIAKCLKKYVQGG